MTNKPHSEQHKGTLNRLGAAEIVRGVTAGAFTCEAVVRDCLARIEAREGVVRAWINLDPDGAIAQARALDRGTRRGMLQGVPIGVKDVLDSFDLPTEMGSEIYRGYRPVADAAVVALARTAGAVILGKTVTCEFAGQTPRGTANPLNPAHTPGGSSSGSAAAVADFMVPAAFGTQTGGSVLRPSSFCGVIGFKPSYNAFNRFGVKPAAEGLDTIGLIARTIDDVELLRAALLGGNVAAISSASLFVARAPRIAFCRTYLWPKAQGESRHAVEDAAAQFRAAGAEVSEITLPDAFSALNDAHRIIDGYERAMTMAHEWAHHRDKISPSLRERIEQGLATPHADYVAANRLAENCRAQLGGLFGAADVLLVPCANGEAPKGLDHTGDPSFQALWTLLHVPTIALPAGKGPHGLPVGIQLVGRRFEDDRLLAAARWATERLEAPGRHLTTDG